MHSKTQVKIKEVPDKYLKRFLYHSINHTALRKAKIVYNFGLSECNRVKLNIVASKQSLYTYCLIKQYIVASN